MPAFLLENRGRLVTAALLAIFGFWLLGFRGLLGVLAAYLCGSVPYGLLIAKHFCSIDPREQGSKNVGSTNVARLCGAKWGFLTLFCDAGKGFFPVLIAIKTSDSATMHSAVALAALFGHLYSVFLGFKGGKAVATTVGVFLPLAFWQLLIAGIICIAAIWRSGFVSLGSLILVTLMPILLLIAGKIQLLPLSLIIAGLVFYKHRENIQRLISGQEKPWRREKKE